MPCHHGHDVVLPGSPRPPVPFLVYPNAKTGGELVNSLDPTTFRYEIHARELAA